MGCMGHAIYWRVGRSRVSLVSLCALLAWLILVSGVTDAAEPEEPEPIEPFAGTPTLSPEKEEIAQRIFNELIAPCCWTTTVAQHGSGAAPRIQAEVRHLLGQGMTYQEIMGRYVDEYGERILAQPKRRGFNLAAYWVPYLALAAGIGVVVLSVRRGMRRRHGAEVTTAGRTDTGDMPPQSKPVERGDDDYRRRIEEELRRVS